MRRVAASGIGRAAVIALLNIVQALGILGIVAGVALLVITSPKGNRR